VDESTGVADREAAEAIRSKREWEITQGSIVGKRRVATFLEAAVSYLESGGDQRFIKPLLDHFGTTRLDKIDQAAIEAAGRKLYPGVAPSTLNRQLFTPMAAILHHAHKRGLVEHRVIERPKQPPGVVRWLPPDEADQLIAAAAPHLAPLLQFLFGVGCRIGEALWLDWRHVDLARGHVSFVKTKNTEARGVPLHPRVIAALANLPHRDGEVFRKPNGEPYERPKRIDDTSAGSRIKTAFGGACRRAGIENFRPHDCRHTWATWVYAATRDLAGLMKLGGWKSERMVLRYAHINVDHLAPAIHALPWGKSGEGQNRDLVSIVEAKG
jgi:integrase